MSFHQADDDDLFPASGEIPAAVMNRFNTASGISTDHAIKPKRFMIMSRVNNVFARSEGPSIIVPLSWLMKCSENETAVLAADLVGMLPPLFDDNRELDASPFPGVTLEQLDQQIERR